MALTTSVFQPISTILQQLIASLQASQSALTDFNIGSNLRDIFEAFAIVVSDQTAVADQLQIDSYLDTATGSALDAIAGNFLVARLPAVQASGQLTITRQDTTGALLLAAGWGQLATSPTGPGQSGVAVVTTQDANFSVGQAVAVVSAQAVLGGSAGNLAISTFLTPLAPVNTISNQNGYQVTTAFTNGVDVESDAAYRARVPITVQGRVKGQVLAFQAAALSVPGVLSAGVLPAGSIRGDGSSVSAGSVEVYYQGSVGLLSAVTSAVITAATANQNPAAFASISLGAPRGQKRLIANLGVYCHAGTDPTALAVAIVAAMQAYINGSSSSTPVGIGKTVYLSKVVDAILNVPGVISATLPLPTFCLFGSTGAGDIACAADSYANLAAADVTVTVTSIP